MINGSWQRRSTTESTESTERYCFLRALCGSKPFQEIIKSLKEYLASFMLYYNMYNTIAVERIHQKIYVLWE